MTMFSTIPLDTLQKIANAWVEQQNQLSVGDGLITDPATLFEKETNGWQSALPGTFIINCDATFSKATASASIAAILRDSEGRQAVCCLACFLAQNHNLSFVEIESDNQTIIKLCVSETIPPWESVVVVSNIR
ncbi:hypothetical protein ACSBR2_030284 [Camellia fascicularis]